MKLKNKVAIVTGGSKGIGEEIAKAFAAEGAKVVVCDMNPLGYENENVAFYPLNVADATACKLFFEWVLENYQRIDILVNNAGITRDAMTRKMTDAQWDAVINVNLKGVFNLTRYVGPHMEEIGGGSIINISSVVGVFGNIDQANYAAEQAPVW